MLFQTQGPQVMGAPTPIPARAWPKDAAHAQVRLATDVSVGEICFAGVARDSVGNLSTSGSVQACVHTTAPPFFNGCSLAGSDTRAGAAALPLPLALLALWLRRRAKT
jgi:hypothetical protein